MGQYYKICNLDKKQFLHPHKFGQGLKLMEFGCDNCGILTALTVLLSSGNGRGGGDLHFIDPARRPETLKEFFGTDKPESVDELCKKYIGSWAGDRIVVAGDYMDAGLFLEDVSKREKIQVAKKRYESEYEKGKENDLTLYSYSDEKFEDISLDMLAVICRDEYVREQIIKSSASYSFGIGEHIPSLFKYYPEMKKAINKAKEEKTKNNP